VWTCWNGTQDEYTQANGYGAQLGYVFGRAASKRGIVIPAIPFCIQDNKFNLYFTRGYAQDVLRAWWYSGGGFSEEYSAVEIDTYDDVRSSYKPASATGAGNNQNVQPHYLPAGTYARTDAAAGGWESETDKLWLRVGGILNPTSAPYSAPPGIAMFLAQNSNWGCDISSAFHASSISAWNAGGWDDEFAGVNYFKRIAGQVPEFGKQTQEQPKISDVLAELCDLVNSDLFYKDGRWFPKRRAVAATATATIGQSDVIGKVSSTRGGFKHPDYANELVPGYNQSVLSEPKTGTDEVPVSIPWEPVIRDWDEILRRGGILSGKISRDVKREWWRFDMAQDWEIGNSGRQKKHLQYWITAHKEQLDHRAQPQLWVEATLPARYLWLEQGDTIEYDGFDHVTSRKGQIREIRINLDMGKPVTLTVKSWHINF